VSDDRNSRQATILPPAEMLKYAAIVVGVGAIGRQVAIQLAAAGIAQLHLMDFDMVETPNLGTQGYFLADLNHPKVDATAALCRSINPDVHVTTMNGRFDRIPGVMTLRAAPVMFCCVDSMAARREIWSASRDAGLPFFVDGRMAGEIIRILTATSTETYDSYATQLFDDHEAFQATCTQRGSIFTSNIAGGLMVSQFSKFLRSNLIDPDFFLDLRCMGVIRP
jgi:molybdopterin-synthase adenylyltransferase